MQPSSAPSVLQMTLNFTLLFVILGTGVVAATPAPSLPADGECQSPFAEPDLDGELDAHGFLQSVAAAVLLR